MTSNNMTDMTDMSGTNQMDLQQMINDSLLESAAEEDDVDDDDDDGEDDQLVSALLEEQNHLSSEHAATQLPPDAINLEDEDDIDLDLFLGLEQKLASKDMSTPVVPSNATAVKANIQNNASTDAKSVEQLPVAASTNVVPTAEAYQQLLQENALLKEQLRQYQLTKHNEDPNAPSTDDLLEQISSLETQNSRLQQENKGLTNQLKKQQQQQPSEKNHSCSNGSNHDNSSLDVPLDEQTPQQQPATKDTPISPQPPPKNESSNGSTQDTTDDGSGGDQTTNTTSTSNEESTPIVPMATSTETTTVANSSSQKVQELEQIVQSLQERIMVLVEEKLKLQISFDSLEHQSKQKYIHVEVDHKGVIGTPTSKHGNWFLSSHKDAAKDSENGNVSEDNDNAERDNDTGDETSDANASSPPPTKTKESFTTQADFVAATVAKKKNASSVAGRWGELLSGAATNLNLAKVRTFSDDFAGSNHENGGVEHTTQGVSNDEFDKVVEDFETDYQVDLEKTAAEKSKGSAGFSISSLGGLFHKQQQSSKIDPKEGSTSSPSRERPAQPDNPNSAQQRPAVQFSSATPSLTKSQKLSLLLRSSSSNDELSTSLEEDGADFETIDFGENDHGTAGGAASGATKIGSLFAPLQRVAKGSTDDSSKPSEPVGMGLPINQANLLSHYVNKQQQQQQNAKPFGFLSNMIYGANPTSPRSNVTKDNTDSDQNETKKVSSMGMDASIVVIKSDGSEVTAPAAKKQGSVNDKVQTKTPKIPTTTTLSGNV